jgi:hypothetical protein
MRVIADVFVAPSRRPHRTNSLRKGVALVWLTIKGPMTSDRSQNAIPFELRRIPANPILLQKHADPALEFQQRRI